VFKGNEITQSPSFETVRGGMGLVPQGRRVFPTLSVEENLLVAERSPDRHGWNLQRVYKLFPRLHERRNQRAKTLSGGEQQMLAIGRALMTNPKLLILDEATEGLAPVIRQDIWAAIRRLKQEGQSILVVDKTLAELLPVADRCFVLEKGKTVFSGPAAGLTADLQDRYLGV
jgi:branched-chain amino acid transport system ATP-binding protein